MIIYRVHQDNLGHDVHFTVFSNKLFVVPCINTMISVWQVEAQKMHLWIRKWECCAADGSTDAEGVFDTCRSCFYQFVRERHYCQQQLFFFFSLADVRSWCPACCNDNVIDAWYRPELNMGDCSWKQGDIFCFNVYLLFLFRLCFLSGIAVVVVVVFYLF